jgi:hypothetical protein
MHDSRNPPLLGGLVGCGVLAGYSAFFLYSGFIGIAEEWGTVWALVALFAGFVFQSPLPLAIGAFFGALDVWHWPWPGALAWTAPGMLYTLFMLPYALTSLKRKIFNRTNEA